MRDRHLLGFTAILLSAASSLVAFSGGAFAQGGAIAPGAGPAPDSGKIEEVIVTARKRAESIQNVPLAITAYDQDFLNRQAFNQITQLADFTPGLQMTTSSGGDGGAIVLRGIGTYNDSATLDQAVALNFDGVQVSTSLPMRIGTLDMSQVEVLAGPQALFFGKNSPGGVISFHSADPTDDPEAMIRAGYDTTTIDRYVDGMVSGPLAEGLDGRLAVHYSDQDGWLKVDSEDLTAAQTGPYVDAPAYKLPFDRYPSDNEVDTRGSLKYDSGPLELIGKLTYSHQVGNGSHGQIEQLTACPQGVPYYWYAPQPTILNIGNCKPDNVTSGGALPPVVLEHDPNLYGNNPGGHIEDGQLIASLDGKYDLAEQGLTIESVSGWYNAWDFGGPGPYAPTAMANVASAEPVRIGQGSEELRVSSNWTGPINFLAGGFFDKSSNSSRLDPAILLPAGGGWIFPGEEGYRIEEFSYSGFAQVNWDILPDLQLSSGVRYTHEEKDAASIVSNYVQLTDLKYDHLAFNNASPETTLSYKPTSDVMLFVSYKQGFKAGGFDTGYGRATELAADPNVNFTFQPEKIAGYEGGVKSTWLDSTLQLNFTGYDYKYDNLQLISIVPPFSFFTTNAGGADLRGLEGEAVWKPPALSGLTIRGSGAYNFTDYTRFLAQCWGGQTIAEGCNQAYNTATGAYTSQSLAGEPLAFAPRYTANLDLDYESDIGEFPRVGDLVVGIASNTSYSSSFFTDSPEEPTSRQTAFAKEDLSLRISRADNFWELEFIGRNLFNTYTLVETHNASFTGGGAGTTSGTLADEEGQVSIGREFLVQLTIRPSL